jgi:predicted adenylyl cyclase CyaB
MPRNIEIKARIDRVEDVLPTAQRLASKTAERIEQDDTFFQLPADRGRLKLRQFADGTAELIHYHRPDTGDAKASDYVRVAAPDPAGLREALARGCGLLGRVQKTRLLVLMDDGGFHTRIHLDRVQGLGDFMELEVVLSALQNDQQGTEHAEDLMRRLGLANAARVAVAYLDLLQAADQLGDKAAGKADAKKS